ncbi:hypothetical protein D3C76_1077210 [compost metagenome]
MHHECRRTGLNQAGIVGRVVQGIVAELETTTGAEGQVRGANGKTGVGQVAQAGVDLHRDDRLCIGDAGERQLDDHQCVAGTHAISRSIYHQEIAVGIFCQRVGGVARGIERHLMARQVLPQVTGGDEVHPVIAILARGRQCQVDERGETWLSRWVGEIHGEGKGIPQQHIAAGGG